MATGRYGRRGRCGVVVSVTPIFLDKHYFLVMYFTHLRRNLNEWDCNRRSQFAEYGSSFTLVTSALGENVFNAVRGQRHRALFLDDECCYFLSSL